MMRQTFNAGLLGIWIATLTACASNSGGQDPSHIPPPAQGEIESASEAAPSEFPSQDFEQKRPLSPTEAPSLPSNEDNKGAVNAPSIQVNTNKQFHAPEQTVSETPDPSNIKLPDGETMVLEPQTDNEAKQTDPKAGSQGTSDETDIVPSPETSSEQNNLKWKLRWNNKDKKTI